MRARPPWEEDEPFFKGVAQSLEKKGGASL